MALERPARAACRNASARRTHALPAEESFEVEGDGEGLLVVRSSFARGWRAAVDGRPAEVLRANAKHMAVPVPAGRHRVDLRYVAPGLRAGLAVTAVAALATLVLAVFTRPRGGEMRDQDA